MRVCVMGASGFVGAGLVRALLAQGHQVLAVGRSRPLSDEGSTAAAWLQWNLETSPPPLHDHGTIDVVVHLAGRAHVIRESSKSPQREFWRANVKGSEHIADAAAAAGARRLIFASSIGVHGGAFVGDEPVTEASPIQPLEPYAVSKREAELVLERKAAETGMELVVLRPALVAGSGAPGNLNRLAEIVRNGLPLPVPYRENARSFAGLNNLTDLVVRCIDHPDAAGETFVVSEADWPSTRQAIEWIGEGMAKPARTIRMPEGLLRGSARVLGKGAAYDKLFGDVRVDASRVRERLDWKPTEGVADALRAVGRGQAGI